MGTKLVAGGIIEKNGKFLLVKEKQKICDGKWNLPAGAVDDGENVIEAAKREIIEECGVEVNINGIIEIINKNMEGRDLLVFFFDTQIIDENLEYDKNEISEIGWFSYEELLNMKEELRADGYFLDAIKKKLNNNVTSLGLINI